jgi:hypothetical protein
MAKYRNSGCSRVRQSTAAVFITLLDNHIIVFKSIKLMALIPHMEKGGGRKEFRRI